MSMPLAQRAFPSRLERETKALDQVMGRFRQVRLATDRFIQVSVGKDELFIPYRIYDQDYEGIFAHLTETQSILYSCLLTRHHDGYVRQRHLERVISIREAWVVPFVMQLTGEYVIQIIETVEAHLPTLDPELYGRFVRDNQAYFHTTRARMISYWDCYYRGRHPSQFDYAGFRLFSKFASLGTVLINIRPRNRNKRLLLLR
ncbi:hypothetical protein CS078_10310 [Pseudomonas prosekii]|uniref:Uncharacterized protein n=1 Tax=Pseudomonas prosekii TaxID=1148509 RepID=A0A3L8CGM5_9PSED|nr:hypothetical protein [Pseudomonas prosekii]RLU07402.1 hypothetical protein CS076_18295 [Pseudomonas prosekii]RLU10501.1 hypothetical protein CS078_10310 [Pseudomonas prosekii]